MPRLHLASRDYSSAEARFAPEVIQNFYVEPLNEAATGFPFQLVPTPGLEPVATGLGGQGRGLYYVDGAADDQLITVHGGTVYGLSGYTPTSLGDVPDDGEIVRFASSGSSQLAIASAGSVSVYDNAQLETVTDPDLPAVGDITYGNGRYIVTERDAGRFYVSGVDNAGSWEGLDFFTPTDSPDKTRGCVYQNDTLYLLGAETVELWAPTGDSTAPFRPQIGGVLDKGLWSRESYVVADNAICFVGDDRMIYRIGGGAQRISDHATEELLENLADPTARVELARWTDRGHEFLVLHIGGVGSRLYSFSTQRWTSVSTYGRTLWRPRMTVRVGGDVVAVDGLSDTLYRFTRQSYLDDDKPIVRIATALDPVVDGNQPRDNFVLVGKKGVGLDGAGQGSDPEVLMRYSDDGGRSWSDSQSRSLGKIGDTQVVTRWNNLGSVRSPGRAWEIRYSDPVGAFLWGADVNRVHA